MTTTPDPQPTGASDGSTYLPRPYAVSLREPWPPETSAVLESVQAAHDDATDPRVNPCPECDTGEVVDDGPWERDTGHQPVRCSDRCGWTA